MGDDSNIYYHTFTTDHHWGSKHSNCTGERSFGPGQEGIPGDFDLGDNRRRKVKFTI